MAAGDIGSVIDAFTFDASFGDTPEIIHISGNVYAIAYTGPDGDGFLKTVTIALDGTIGGSAIDTWEFNNESGLFPSIIHVGTTFYAIAHAMSGVGGVIKTIEIDAAGNIGAAAVDVLTFLSGTCTEPIIKHVFGDIYAIVYRGSGADGWICTIDIDSSGNIGAATIDSLEYDNANGYEPKLIHVAGEIFAIAYRGTDVDGFLKTLAIDASGNIGASPIDSYEFDTDQCYTPDIIKISGGVFAIAYDGPDSDGFIITVGIDIAGNITTPAIDTLEFDTNSCIWPFICLVSGDIYAIAYSGTDSDGFLVTLSIDAAGNIGPAVLDSLEFDTDNCHQPGMIRITTNVFAIAYQGFGDTGVLKTYSIEPPVEGSQHILLMGIG